MDPQWSPSPVGALLLYAHRVVENLCDDAPGIRRMRRANGQLAEAFREFSSLNSKLGQGVRRLLRPNRWEGEWLVSSTYISEGSLYRQEMAAWEGAWSGGQQMFWAGAQPAAQAEVPVSVATDGHYQVQGYFTKAPDYGIFQLYCEGRPVGTHYDAYSAAVVPSGRTDIGNLFLHKGKNTLVFRIEGKQPSSTGYLFGLDCATARPHGRLTLILPRICDGAFDLVGPATETAAFVGGSPDPPARRSTSTQDGRPSHNQSTSSGGA